MGGILCFLYWVPDKITWIFTHEDYYSGLSGTEISPLKRTTSEIYNITFKSPAMEIHDSVDEGNSMVGGAAGLRWWWLCWLSWWRRRDCDEETSKEELMNELIGVK